MDVITYALAKKMVSSVASGITEVQTDGTNIRFKTAEGEWFTVRLNSVENATVSGTGHLIITLTDGATIDAGVLPVGTMDAALSATSENGVQNKVITAALNGKQNVLTAGTGISIDNTDPANPEISANVDYTNLINKPTKLSDFTNDEGFIDNTVNNLTNYYLKTQTYTQAEVNALVDTKLPMVTSLPASPSNGDAVLYIGTSSGGLKAGGIYQYQVSEWVLISYTDSAHIAQNTANFAPAFSEVTSYAVGDYVTYNNVLYRCTTAHTAGTWVAGHFTAVTVGGDLNAIVPSDASASNKLITKNGLNAKTNGVPYVTGENYSSTDLNEYLTPCITFINVSSYTNVPSNTSSVAYMLEVKATGNKGSTDLPYISQILTAYDKSEKFIRSRNPNSGTWSSWQKLVTESDLTTQTAYRYYAFRGSGTSDVSLELLPGVYLVEYDTHGSNSGHGMILLTCTSTTGNVSSVVAWTGSGTAPTFTFSSGNLVGTYATSGYFWLQAIKIGDYY